MLMENGIWGAPDAFVKREGSERVWGHLAAQDAGEAHINIVLAAFVPASYLDVAPLRVESLTGCLERGAASGFTRRAVTSNLSKLLAPSGSGTRTRVENKS